MLSDESVSEAADLFASEWPSASLSETREFLRSRDFTTSKETDRRIDFSGREIRIAVYQRQNLVSRIECNLSARDMTQFMPERYGRALEEAEPEFEQMMSALRVRIGSPIVFLKGGSDVEQPEAIWLARWAIKSGELTLQIRHDDKELPIRVLLMIRPAAP